MQLRIINQFYYQVQMNIKHRNIWITVFLFNLFNLACQQQQGFKYLGIYCIYSPVMHTFYPKSSHPKVECAS